MTQALHGRAAIVVGGASGIGEAALDAFLAAGARVVSLDIQSNAKDGTRDRDSFCAIACDVRSKEAVERSVAQAVSFLGRLDVLCVPAGITARGMPEDLGEDAIRNIFEVNVFGTMYTNQAAFPHLKDKGGAIINFTSIAGVRGMEKRAHYCATKGAVAAWTRAIALDWARYNIRANAIAPIVHTPIVERIRASLPAADRPAFEQSLGREQRLPGGLRSADALAPMMVLLASEGASYMTGQVLSLDGGVCMVGS